MRGGACTDTSPQERDGGPGEGRQDLTHFLHVVFLPEIHVNYYFLCGLQS